MSSSNEHHVVPVRVYNNVLFALLALTVLTVVAARIDFGMFHTFIALFIATVKAGFVGAIFMNLKYDDKQYALILGLSIFFLILLYGISIVDFVTRTPIESTL